MCKTKAVLLCFVILTGCSMKEKPVADPDMLFPAIKKGDVRGVKDILSQYPLLLTELELDAMNRTPLHCAIFNDQEAVVECILGLGVDPNLSTMHTPGETPMVTSFVKYMFTNKPEALNEKIIALLLKNGANPNVSYLGRTCLMEAARCGNLDLVRMLIKKGADKSAVDRPTNGSSVLHFAAVFGKSVEIVEYLIAKGCDIEFKNSNDHSVLEAVLHDMEAMRSVIKVNPNEIILSGIKRSQKVVESLKKHGAKESLGILKNVNSELIRFTGMFVCPNADGSPRARTTIRKNGDIKSDVKFIRSWRSKTGTYLRTEKGTALFDFQRPSNSMYKLKISESGELILLRWLSGSKKWGIAGYKM